MLIPGSIKIHVSALVIAPFAVHSSRKTPVLHLREGGELVLDESFESRLGRFQDFEVFDSRMNDWRSCFK